MYLLSPQEHAYKNKKSPIPDVFPRIFSTPLPDQCVHFLYVPFVSLVTAFLSGTLFVTFVTI
jgi:hypothetical protein